MCDLCERRTIRLTPLQCHTHSACISCVKTWSILKNGRKVVACPICTDPDVIIDPVPNGKTKRRRESAPQPIDTGCYEDLEGYNNDIERLLNPTVPKQRHYAESTLQVDRLTSVRHQHQATQEHDTEAGDKPLIKYDPTTGKAIKYFPYRLKERDRTQHQPPPSVNVKDVLDRLEMRDLGRISAMLNTKKMQDNTSGNRPTTRTAKRNRTEKEDLEEEWDFSMYANPMIDYTNSAVPCAANNWGADTVETLCASAWLRPMDLKIDSASVAAYSDTTAEYGSDDDKLTVHNSSRHTFVIDDEYDEDEDNDGGRTSGRFSTMPDSDEDATVSGLRVAGVEQERNSSPCKAKRGNNPIDWIPNTPLPDVPADGDGLRPPEYDDEDEDDEVEETKNPVQTRRAEETGSMPNVRPEDEDSTLAIDGPGFYGSDNQLFGQDTILVKAATDTSLEDFWSM